MATASRPTFTVEDLTIALNTVNRPEYLRAAVNSLLETTPPGVTLQVLFNGSEPAVREATTAQLSSWPGPTRFIHHDDILPIDESHNAALAAVTTPLVNFMGDDDLVLGERLARIVDTFNRTKPLPAVVTSFARRIAGSPHAPAVGSNKDLGPTTVAEWRAWHDRGEPFEMLWPGAVLRVDALRAIGGWEPLFAASFDNRILSQMSFHGPVLAIPDRNFGFRIHGGSLTTSRWRHQREVVRFVAACHKANVAGEPEPTFDQFRTSEREAPALTRWTHDLRDRSGLHFRVGGEEFLSGDRISGARHLIKAAVLWPPAFVEKVKDQVGRLSLSPDDNSTQPTVVFLFKNCNQYRARIYELLQCELAERGINLRLLIGGGVGEDIAKGDSAALSWAEYQPVKEISIAGRSMLWQPAFKAVRGADLVVTEQASKQLFNVVLAFGQRALRTRHAFWGHGRNFQASVEGTSGEGLKQKLTAKAHWFFAYNELSRQAAIEAGMPADRVTPLMNSTDTAHIRRVMATLPADNDTIVRRELGMGDGPVVVFIGGLYPLKRPAFLVDMAYELRREVPDVEMLVIGDGSLGAVVADAAAEHDWIHAVGAQYGDERIRLASIASLQVTPGAIGLNIVDAFALGLPSVTTDLDYHGPEIEYLIDGVNGLIVEGDPDPARYAAAVAAVLTDQKRLVELSEGAYEAGGSLSAEDMAERLASGIEQALAAPARR